MTRYRLQGPPRAGSLILPTEETLCEDIDGSASDDTAPPLIKVLVGFTNTMTPGQAPPAIKARFRDHALDGTVKERIAGTAIFTPHEFNQADHHVFGEFDKFGQFRGKVQVYGTKPADYLLPWREARGKPLLCGPLKINLAYLQAEERATKLPPEDHARLKNKLNRIGGLHIYRDGIRILPYGNSDYDFLNIEQRRTKQAAYYFFSYRRIFGVIDITRNENSKLVEKAGREGFRENLAYRQLKRLLENFFVQLAAEFFREGGLRTEDFINKITLNDLMRLVDSGPSGLTKIPKVPSGKGPQDKLYERLYLLFSNELETGRSSHFEFARAGAHTREQALMASDYRATLDLGSVVQGADEYFVCIQPSCDALRLKEPTPFIFASLLINVSQFDVVVRNSADENICLKLDTQASRNRTFTFDPDKSTHTVLSSTENDAQTFTSTSREDFTWICDLGTFFAQRFVHRIASNLSRIGLDEFKWQRRHSPRS